MKALQGLFSHLPDDLGLAYVVIVHLAPDHPSALSEILAGSTSMPVFPIIDKPPLSPNCVYVIPPDRELVIDGNDITARPFTEPRGKRAPIDMFFRSIAAGRGDGMAVILSGAGSDGALGVRAVKEAGGIVFVQEPSEAEYSMMPRSALATGAADFVAPLRLLAERLAEMAVSKKAARPVQEADCLQETDLQRIFAFLRSRTGQDFSNYKKRATMLRRIGRRMQVARVKSLDQYANYLLANPEEAQELFSDLLISVRSFFRDPAAYQTLAAEAIGPIFDDTQNAGIRAWVAGCATGEEAYSLAILMLEEAHRRKVAVPIQIFATDLDEGALATAREGRYPKSVEGDLSEERLQRWFVPEGPHYCVHREVRDIVLFAKHSVLKDPPFLRLNLISCRNLLIYLERKLQRQVCALFHYGLNPRGFLFLGSAETLDATPDTFFPISREARLYRARPTAHRTIPLLSGMHPEHHHLTVHDRHGRTAGKPRRDPASERGMGAGHAAALERHAPPSVLVDSENSILHLSPSAGRFFLPGAGPFATDIINQIRPELRLDLSGALRRAFDQGDPTISMPLLVAFNGTMRRIQFNVCPVREADGSPPYQAIIFFLDGGPANQDIAERRAEGDAEETQRLREELRLAQERLHASRLEHEGAIQDLRITNEELQSVNEEYRSTSEELETSKEELQSINEELQTVNGELKAMLENISTAHSDLQNLVTSTQIGALCLDTELRIRMFTPAVARLFNIADADVGRRITDFTHRLRENGVETEARRVLEDLIPVEREVQSQDQDWLQMRLRPYRTIDDRIEGVVITFADISARKRAEDALSHELRAMIRLQELSTRTVESEALEPPLQDILDAAVELVGAQLGFIQLLDERKERVRIAVQHGHNRPFLDRFGDLPVSQGTPWALSLRGESVFIADSGADRSSQPHLGGIRAAGIRAQAATRLRTTSGLVVGVLNLNFTTPQTFNDHQKRLLVICARQAADAIHAWQLQQVARESELRLRKVLETDAVGVLFFDDQGMLVDCNAAFLDMSGLSREQIDSRSLHWRNLSPPESVAEMESKLATLIETGKIAPYEKEIVHTDHSKRWMLFAGRRIEKNLIVEYAIDITDRKRAEEERELLARELAHRVKNTLSVVQALAYQTGGASIAEFREAFTGRLAALAEGHSHLLASDWRSADLRKLIRGTVSMFDEPERSRVEIEGEDLTVTPKQALALSLILHELVTNAAKYGALSDAHGRVQVTWKVEQTDREPIIRLTWLERDGRPILAPSAKKRGFGTQLIEHATDYELDGKAELRFKPAGVVCKITFPVRTRDTS